MRVPMQPAAVPAPAGKRTNVRWMMVLMAFLATAINYVDRSNLSVAAPFIAEGVRPQLGHHGLRSWARSSGPTPPSRCPRDGSSTGSARASPTRSRSSGGRCSPRPVPWRVASLRCSASGCLLGVGEAPAYPCNAKVVSEWFPRSERAFATSIFDSGARSAARCRCPSYGPDRRRGRLARVVRRHRRAGLRLDRGLAEGLQHARACTRGCRRPSWRTSKSGPDRAGAVRRGIDDVRAVPLARPVPLPDRSGG